VLSATVRGERVAMRMTDPTGLSLRRSVALDGRRVPLGFVNTGVPHAVIPVRALDRTDVVAAGRRLRYHRQFSPRGTNVDFIQPDPRRPGRLRVRTYERGVEAETPACGTGVAASAIIHALRQADRMNGRTRRHRVEVQTRSGDLLAVSFQAAPGRTGPRVTDVVLEGPARRVFEGTFEPREATR
jgi:diaminopimelate epimerase